jgi:hypothetical protein
MKGGLLRRVAPRNDAETRARVLAAQSARVFALSSRPKNRGRRERRVPAAPAASCAKCRKHTSVVTTVTPETPGIPRAMVLTVSFVLSRVTGLVCHPRRRSCLHQLDSSVGASGPHDFAVRIRRASSLRAVSVHRIPPHVRDDRETPLLRDGTQGMYC